MPSLSRGSLGHAVALLAVLALTVLSMVLATPVVAHADAADGTWSASGPATTSLINDGSTADPGFNYSFQGNSNGASRQLWTFESTATASGPISVPYAYTGYHGYDGTSVFLNAFIDGSPPTTTSLVNAGPVNCCSPPSGGFSYSGTFNFDVQAGQTYGFTLGGGDLDPNAAISGTLSLGIAPPSAFNQPAPISNTSWPTATTLGANDSTTDAIDQPGEERWYRFPVQPDSQVQVTLSNLPADDDLALFSDIGQAFAAQSSTLTDGSSGGSITGLTQLAAESPSNASSPSIFSPSIFSPSIFSPSVFSPSIFSPSTSSPSIFSPSIFSPSIFSPSIFSPSIFSPSIFSPSIFSPSIFSPTKFEQAYASAQVASLLDVSTQQGTANKTVSADTWNNTGYFYVRVSSDNGAAAPGDYTLSVTTTGGPCGSPLNTYANTATLTPAAGSAQTVILTDSTRLNLSTLNQPLQQLASETGGVVVDVSQSPKVAALNAQADANPACPYAKNLVAQAIRDIVNSYRDKSGTLKYVVVVGDDDVIPFFRYPDTAGLAPESDYSPPLLSTTAAEAVLASNDYLSDNAYGAASDLSVKGTTLPVPDVAVGRLVEQPSDILTTLDNFFADNGVLPTPNSSLVTGYDFMQPAADQVETQFQDGLGSGATNDTLITNQGVSPSQTTPAGQSPSRNYSWTAADLKNSLFGSHHDLVFLGGHFSANNTLAADYSTTVVTTDLQNAVNSNPDLFKNTLVLSAGCHGGDNIEDSDGVPAVTLGLDWPQAFAQSGATLVSGTGYQYGDTDFVAYSDKLYVDLAQALRSGSPGTAVPIGQALLQADQAYLGGVTQISGLDEKSVLEATLYGLPMLGISMPGDRTGNPTTTNTVTPNPVSSGAGGVLGLYKASLSVSPTLVSHSQDALDTQGNPTGTSFTWLSGPAGVTSNPGEPALPLDSEDVTVPGEVLRGVGFRSGSYTDLPGTTPLTGAPTTEVDSVHTSFVSPAFYPQTLWNPNYYDALANQNGRTSLLITPAQDRSDSATTDDLRKYSQLGLELYYSSNTQTYAQNTPALAGPPTISQVTSSVDDAGNLNVSAHVAGDPSAGIQNVWVTYTGNSASDPLYGSWQSLDLTQSDTDSTLWSATLPAASVPDPGDVSFMLQAVNGVGVVAMDNNGGYYYDAGVTPGVESAGGPSYTMSFDSGNPSTGTYGGTAQVSATLSGPSPGQRMVTFGLGSTTVSEMTDNGGHATADIPLSADPGKYDLTASSDGTAADADAPGFTIAPAATSMTVTGPSASVQSGTDAGVQATLTSGGLPLRQKTVYFDVTDSSDTLVASVVTTTNNNGQAQLGSLSVPPGALTVTASFGEGAVKVLHGGTVDATDADYSASTDHTGVNLFDTTTTSVSAPSAAVAGSDVLATATVDSPDGGGSVAFSVDGSAISTCATQSLQLVSGSYQATCSVSGLSVGPHSITASYSGDPDYSSSQSDPGSVVVKTGTTTGLTGPASPSFGSTVTLTGQVDGSDGGGSVAFKSNGTTLSGCGFKSLSQTGQATCSVTGLSVGQHTFTAAYSGDSTSTTSSSDPLSLTVGKADTTTSVTAPGASSFGSSVTATATVDGSDGGGSVAFSVDGSPASGCTAKSLSQAGQATCSVSGLAVGGHGITASYSGDTDYAGSHSDAATVTVGRADTTTSVTAPGAPSFGTAELATATVHDSDGSGSVAFSVDGSPVSGCTTRSLHADSGNFVATCSVTGLAVGGHGITASYSGDTDYSGSTSGTASVTVGRAATSTSVTSQTSRPFGASVVVTATVRGSDGGGSVAFSVDGSAVTDCSEQPLAAGAGDYQATCTVTGMMVGPHTVEAAYAGDSNYLGSASHDVTVTIVRAPTATSLTAPATSPFGAPVVVTATVTGSVGRGSLAFLKDGKTMSGCKALPLHAIAGAYQAGCGLTGLALGTYQFTAVYTGDSRYAASTAHPVSVVVDRAATGTTLSAPATSSVGSRVKLAATVAAVAPGAGTPGGVVTFRNGTHVVGTAALAVSPHTGRQTATLTVTGLKGGTKAFTATYGGSARFRPSTSSTADTVVTQRISRLELLSF